MFSPDVDLVIDFRVSKTLSVTKQQTREEARKAEKQYTRLIETLTHAGLKAVGRRGELLGHILVFVSCPQALLDNLIKRERLLSGLPVTPIAAGSSTQSLSPADRIRIIHSYISSTPSDGGLGISSDSSDWDLVHSMFPLHNRQFNSAWVKTWKPRNITSMSLSSIREEFGDALAYYFGFLSSYTSFLAFPAALGVFAHYFLLPFSPAYSILIALWATFFIEWWRVREQTLGLRFGTRNSFRVEKRRAQYKPGLSWWQREFRMLLTVPVIVAFGATLVAILTATFVFEAFITHLYQGPGQQLIGFSPTIVFVLFVPRFLALYNAIAIRLTDWENHAHQSTYANSMTLKMFALGALVSYSGISLSAFVYVPFGEGVMHAVQTLLFKPSTATETGLRALVKSVLNGTASAVPTGAEKSVASDGMQSKTAPGPHGGLWDMNVMNARKKLNPGRLRDQMFAITVTNQIVNSFLEIGLPFVLRAANSLFKKGGKTTTLCLRMRRRRVGLQEREYLERVRSEAALPEMVIQFGFVALWGTIWPLAGKSACTTAGLCPSETDTIGPWLNALTFLTWLSAITNTALVYLFSPTLAPPSNADTVLTSKEHLVAAAGGTGNPDAWGIDGTTTPDNYEATKELLLKAATCRTRRFSTCTYWHGCSSDTSWSRSGGRVATRKSSCQALELAWRRLLVLGRILAPAERRDAIRPDDSTKSDTNGFWDHDEGVEEIQRIVKEA
ncbi:calcium-activated chloride channel-domain-containing protein [Coprinopsis sp. MPI-PUGE-AT-0042]|nr:calcium-activated chloride channel-domain-containing protein [Coprinopsis sp. MPI-PUGE-AT-0042]